MIRLRRSRAAQDLHPDYTGANLEAKIIGLVEARIAHGDGMEFTKSLGDWKKTKDVLKRDSHGKCAYCEAHTAVVAHGDVEHFRPKSVYWWLALCVDNYVFSCQICNQSFKGDKFPVFGEALKAPRLPRTIPSTARARKQLAARICPDPIAVDEAELLARWMAEEPDLPHPYLEDPEPLFAWAPVETNGEVLLIAPENGSDRSRRAVRAAICYLGLNRETLTRLRYSVYDTLKFALLGWKVGDTVMKAQAEAMVRAMCQDAFHFAGMCRYFARKAGFHL